MTATRYPIFIPSKGRADACLTARFLQRDGTPFRLVVEPPEEEAYRAAWPDAEILVTPFHDLGLGAVPVRNWIRDFSIEEGHDRHWQLDDNCYDIHRLYRGKIIRADSGVALSVVEDFTDRYTNIGISGLNYEMFVLNHTPAPFYLNCHVYSCSLIWNRMPYHWRGRYNDDTDLCLQVLSAGLCTVNVNAFCIGKVRTMVMKGGMSDEMYAGDGRLKMARSLERAWPGVVTTDRKFQRPQHVIKGSWRYFDTPLIRREDIDWENLAPVDEYGMKLRQVGDQVKSPALQAMLDEADSD